MANTVAIQIGADPASVFAVGEVIIAILASEQDQVTIQKALDSLATSCAVNGTMISKCNITMTPESAEDGHAVEVEG